MKRISAFGLAVTLALAAGACSRQPAAETGTATAAPVAGELRYQACNDSVCFAPANTGASWHLEVT